MASIVRIVSLLLFWIVSAVLLGNAIIFYSKKQSTPALYSLLSLVLWWALFFLDATTFLIVLVVSAIGILVWESTRPRLGNKPVGMPKSVRRRRRTLKLRRRRYL